MTVSELISDNNIPLNRHFVPENESGKVFELVNWEKRTAQIKNAKGEVVFEQQNVDIPQFWSQTATNIVVSKYFSGILGSSEREKSIKQLISRVVNTITLWGENDNYFTDNTSKETFRDELSHIILHQYATFNSPVWFNVGIEDKPQCSACQPFNSLINTVDGLIPIGEIVEKNLIGLPVFDAEGVTNIVNVKHNGKKPVYRIQLADGHFVDATGDHLVCAHNNRRIKKLEWKRVDELDINNYMRIYSEHTETVSLTSKKELISEAALAGWLQADGFVGQYENNTNRSLTVEFMTINEDEQDWIMDHVNQALPNIHYHERPVESNFNVGLITANRIRMYGEILREFVNKYELLNRGINIRVPKSIMTAPNDAVAAYLRSVYESDGYVTNNGQSTHLALATISKEWMEDILVLLSRFGIYARLRRKLEKRSNRHDLWEVDISIYSEREKFRKKIGFISSKKKSRLIESLKVKGKQCPPIRYQKIVEIKKLGSTDVYDIQTQSGNYLSNNVLVHNCFINSIEDNMESILELTKTEGMLFKWGSGTGTNLSPLRSSVEGLSRGGIASGPVSFMKGYDAFAGVIKSGGKCYKKGTLVSTPDGLLPIEQLKKGDLVLTHNGVKNVNDFIPNGRKQCYSVETKEGYEVEVTEGHKFAYWSNELGNFLVKPIEEFNLGDQLYVLIQPSLGGKTIDLLLPDITRHKNETTTVEIKLPNELTGKLAYILGLLYGDGNVTSELWRIRCSFSTDRIGKDSSEQFIEFCKSVFEGYPFLQESDGNWITYTFTRKRLFQFLEINNILKGKAANLGFPEHLFTATMEIRAAFIAGFFDADGNYQKRGGFSIKIIDKPFLKKLQQVLLSLGMPSKIRLARAAVGNWNSLYSLDITGSIFTKRFADIIGQYSVKVRHQYINPNKSHKGWGYKDIKYQDIRKWGEKGTGTFIERSLGYNNKTVGYGGLTTIANVYPEKLVGLISSRITQCVPVTLKGITKTEIDETFDIEVSGEHLLSANGIYASNTRRAAKMVILNIEHPDVMEFIRSKANEERKAWALIDAGYDGSIDGEAYNSVFFQNANHSVRVTDEFMKSVENNVDFHTRRVLTNMPFKKYKARDILKEIAEATHLCGDPGLQFDTIINDWHTSSNTDRIHASNPCSEYMYLNNSACNLASINLLKYNNPNGDFDVDSYIQTIRIMVLAQEILVSNASYPTELIGRNSEDYRPLGLGYANIGALLMALGLPYDSDSGRALAGVLTAIMSGEGYYQSALIARKLKPFNGYEKNREPMLKVMRKHQSFVDKIDKKFVSPNLIQAATSAWDNVIKLGEQHGFRNGQISVLAPTGTIAFMLDCATTGVEPDIALVKYKNLVGGGQIKIVNQTVPQALERLGYSIEQQTKILVHLEENDTIEGAPDLKGSDLPVFDCAFKPRNGKRFIHYMGHVRMMAAVQPFISGAISKTVNVPSNITVEEIADIYLEAWKMGLKAIAIYRDGSKRIQPLSMDNKGSAVKKTKSKEIDKFKRKRLPDTRNSYTHKFSIESHEGYLTVGMYEDGKPGEIFVTMAKEGSTISGLMDSFALAISMLLQHNIELKDLVNKFAHLRFEPSGMTRNPEVPIAKSIIDYIFRWLAIQFLSRETTEEVIKPQKHLDDIGQFDNKELFQKTAPSKKLDKFFSERDQSESEVYTAQSDAPPCSECGAIMTRSGSCYRCLECGSTSGCS